MTEIKFITISPQAKDLTGQRIGYLQVQGPVARVASKPAHHPDPRVRKERARNYKPKLNLLWWCTCTCEAGTNIFLTTKRLRGSDVAKRGCEVCHGDGEGLTIDKETGFRVTYAYQAAMDRQRKINAEKAARPAHIRHAEAEALRKSQKLHKLKRELHWAQRAAEREAKKVVERERVSHTDSAIEAKARRLAARRRGGLVNWPAAPDKAGYVSPATRELHRIRGELEALKVAS